MTDCPRCGQPVSQRRKARYWPVLDGQRMHPSCDTPQMAVFAAIRAAIRERADVSDVPVFLGPADALASVKSNPRQPAPDSTPER